MVSTAAFLWPRQDGDSGAASNTSAAGPPWSFGPPPPAWYLAESRVPVIIGVNATLTAISVVVVVLRLYVRQFMINTLGTDDLVIMLSLLCAIGSMVCFVIETHHGAGRHFAALNMPDDFEELLFWQYMHGPMLVLGVSLVKLSLGLFLLRLVHQVRKGYKYAVRGMMVFVGAFTIASLCTIIFQCIPVTSAWKLLKSPTDRCISNDTMSKIAIWNGVLNITTDIVFVALPVPIILALQVSLQTKITLIFCLSLGFFACIASVMRVVLAAGIYGDMDWMFRLSFVIWNNVELHAGLLAASLPTLKPLFKGILSNVSTFYRNNKAYYGKSGSTRSNSNSASYGKARYEPSSPQPLPRHIPRSAWPKQIEDSIGMEPFPPKTPDKPHTAQALSFGDDDSSDEMIWDRPMPSSITKKVEILVREDA